MSVLRIQSRQVGAVFACALGAGACAGNLECVGCEAQDLAPASVTGETEFGGLGATTGTSGLAGAAPGTSGVSECNAGPQPGAAPIRRMTRFEYNNTLRDLLGDQTAPAETFSLDEEALGFNNNAASLATSPALVDKYMIAAEGAAARATETLSTRLGCDPAVIGEEACGQQFIAGFGKRAFRRPLTTEESTLLLEQFSTGLRDGDFDSGIQMVIETALQSPPFLYRVEFGVPAVSGESSVRLNSWETASRLSYMLWGSMPDDALFAAAEAGTLSTPEQIELQARRMLDSPKAHETVTDFHMQWLDYNQIASVAKSEEAYPSWSSEIGELMTEEIRVFLDDAVFSEGAGLQALLTSPDTFMNDKLAEFYGVPGPGSATFEKVTQDASKRAGVLTLGAVLTLNAHENQSSPIHRGLLVREKFLCDTLPPPPPGVMVEAPEPDPDATTRERFAQHAEGPACVGCHTLIDPLGFGFENYDGLGRYRTKENGLPIDASGKITQSDIDGPFVGVIELANKLAQSDEVKDCYTQQWFRYAYGRGETGADSCSLANLKSRFAESDGSIQELLVALTQTDAFLYRSLGETP